MIVVMNRELIIPNEEFNIGTNYDNQTETRLFQLRRVTAGGIDISNLTFKLDIKYANDNVDTAELVSEVTGRDINLTWTITNSVLQVPGTVLVQIRALDTDGLVKWTSYIGAFFVEDAINTPAKYTGDLTEFEKIETAEAGRVKAENERIAAETLRAEAETLRDEAETERKTAETARKEAESLRQSAEDEREAAEEIRKATFTETAKLAESYAVGGTGTRSGEDTDNAKYYSEQAGSHADAASTSETNAAASASDAEQKKFDAEAWAKGTRNGVAVESGDETYHNNAKYYSDNIKEAAAGGVMLESIYDTQKKGTDIFLYVDDKVATEKSRAESAESTISAAVSAETTRATDAEGTLATNLAAEVTRAKTAEEANATAAATAQTAIDNMWEVVSTW